MSTSAILYLEHKNEEGKWEKVQCVDEDFKWHIPSLNPKDTIEQELYDFECCNDSPNACDGCSMYQIGYIELIHICNKNIDYYYSIMNTIGLAMGTRFYENYDNYEYIMEDESKMCHPISNALYNHLNGAMFNFEKALQIKGMLIALDAQYEIEYKNKQNEYRFVIFYG